MSIATIIPFGYFKKINNESLKNGIQVPEYGVNFSKSQVKKFEDEGVTAFCHALNSLKHQDELLISKLSEEIKEIFKDYPALSVDSYKKIIEINSSKFDLGIALNMDSEGNLGLLISDIGVKEEFRGMGYGKKILEQLSRLAKNNDLSYLQIDLSINDQWWLKQGFKRQGKIVETSVYLQNLKNNLKNIDKESLELSVIGTFRKDL